MSELVAQLHFLRPHWLWALLALPLLALHWRWRQGRAEVWRRHVDPHLLPHLLEGGSSRDGVSGLAARLLATALVVFALAGPSWRQGDAVMEQGGRALVVALDLSDAMLAGDLPPSRLAQARTRLAQVLRAHGDGDVALIAFSADAFTVAPLTGDSANVALFLDALQPEIMPEDGHRPDRAIEAAVALLRQAGHADGDILLMTQAADMAAAAAAARAAAAGFRVSVLGTGRAGAATFRARDGSLRSAAYDGAPLRRVATAGGGRYTVLAELVDDGDALVAALPDTDTGTGAREAGVQAGARSWRDEGYWLLLPLMLLALAAFRRGAALVVLVLVLLPPPPLLAADVAPGSAWRRPDQVAHARMRDGIEAYRAGRYGDAEQAWRGLPGAEAAYNRGNALARQGRYQAALEAYDQALQRQPGMADALANRRVVEAALRRQQAAPSGGDAGDGEGESEGSDAPGAQGGGNASPAQDPSSGEAGDQPGSPADAPPDTSGATGRDGTDTAEADPTTAGSDAQAAQDRADAAQRQRMQQALDRDGGPADDGPTVDGDPGRAETEAERERRQAAEAWLRRVPDDPGGLLRARFRLEYERRNGRREVP